MRKLIAALLTVMLLMLVTSCYDTSYQGQDNGSAQKETKSDSDAQSAGNLTELTEKTLPAKIVFADGREISLELYPDLAPKTVKNFIKNAKSKFYNETIFHRVIEGFMIQGGGFDTDYNPKRVKKTVKGEFSDNGVENELSHTRGVLSMARSDDFDSASTQFFIVHSDSLYLDGQYAAFGRVTDGMDIVDEIAAAELLNNPPAGLKNVPKTQYVIDDILILD